MKYYLDIKIVPDAEVPIYFIRNKVYSKLHKALSSLNSVDIGISFPKYKTKLSDIIRLHGRESRLAELQAMNWIGSLSGYCEVSEIQAVPERIIGYRVVSRKQSTMNLNKLKKRIQYQKEQGILKTQGEIKEYEKQYKAKIYATGLDSPYLELDSSSNGHKYRRYIQFSELKPHAIDGEFDQFGLSKTATIPWF